MATGLQRLVRRAVLARLKADAPLTALVAAASIHPLGAPTWPFVILRAPVSRPLRAACVAGATVTFDIHAFAAARKTGEQVVETAEDHAGRIGGAIEAALNDNRIALDGGHTAKIALTEMRLLEDEEPEAFHYFAQIDARVLAEAALA